MKRLIYILLLLSVTFSLYSLTIINPEKYPPEEDLIFTMDLYPNYVFFGNTRMVAPVEVSFAHNHRVYTYINDSIDTLGLWIIKKDTLLIYQNWSRYKLDETEEKIYNHSEYDFRSYLGGLHWRKNSDMTFPRNVSAFLIFNRGDSLFALNDEENHIGIPVSSKGVRDRHYYFTGIATLPYYDYEPTNWLDTLYWHPMLNSKDIIFTIKKIDTTCLSALKSGIIFNILNPRYYPQAAALPYAKRREYCEWFDRVKVGDTISLELTRPAYEQEVFDRSPYLRGYPDTIYVLDNEAYGYWFAKPIYKNQ